MTGLWPPSHGVRNNGIHYAAESLLTLAERLHAQGLKTAAFISAAVLDRQYGLDQGFDVYDDNLAAGKDRSPRLIADRSGGSPWVLRCPARQASAGGSVLRVGPPL
jgi:arylsulfatase A-like enzyme